MVAYGYLDTRASNQIWYSSALYYDAKPIFKDAYFRWHVHAILCFLDLAGKKKCPFRNFFLGDKISCVTLSESCKLENMGYTRRLKSGKIYSETPNVYRRP